MDDMNEQEANVDSSTYPFLAHATPRPGQLEMIEDGIKALNGGGFHLAAAPLGLEKQLLRWRQPLRWPAVPHKRRPCFS